MEVPIAFVAMILNTTISKAQRKFGGKGHVALEDLIEWVEKHSGHTNYHYWIESINKLEKRLAANEEADQKEKGL